MRATIDIAFVILHFMTDQDTSECIDSIRENIDTNNYQIVIVDNASSNDSLKKLQSKYAGFSNLSFISNDKNYGFAKGMNSGIKYIREHWDAKFLIIANNDILLLTKNIFSVLQRKYNEYNFAVLGPMMITGDAKCSTNPMRIGLRTKEKTREQIKEKKKLLRLCNLHIYVPYVWAVHFIKPTTQKVKSNIYLCDQVNYKLHGAFLVFSATFFQKFNGLDESTFLYEEEEILYLHIIKNGLLTLYTPEIIVFHKEDSATKEILPNKEKKARFTNKHELESLKIYIDIYEKYDAEGK